MGYSISDADDRSFRLGAWHAFSAMKIMLDIDLVLPLNYAAVLCLVGSSEHGVTVQDIMRDLGMTQAAASRAVQRLSQGSSASKHVGVGLDLITRAVDPQEPRRHIYTLTAAGMTTLNSFLVHLNKIDLCPR